MTNNDLHVKGNKLAGVLFVLRSVTGTDDLVTTFESVKLVLMNSKKVFDNSIILTLTRGISTY